MDEEAGSAPVQAGTISMVAEVQAPLILPSPRWGRPN